MARGSYAGSCSPSPAAASFKMMLGTLGLWVLFPAAVQGKCLQGGAVSFHSPNEAKGHLCSSHPFGRVVSGVGK